MDTIRIKDVLEKTLLEMRRIADIKYNCSASVFIKDNWAMFKSSNPSVLPNKNFELIDSNHKNKFDYGSYPIIGVRVFTEPYSDKPTTVYFKDIWEPVSYPVSTGVVTFSVSEDKHIVLHSTDTGHWSPEAPTDKEYKDLAKVILKTVFRAIDERERELFKTPTPVEEIPEPVKEPEQQIFFHQDEFIEEPEQEMLYHQDELER